MGNTVLDQVVLTPQEVARRPSEPLGPGVAGVSNTVLWEHAGAGAGVLSIPAGTTLPRHQHRAMGHHVWVLEGAVLAFARTLRAGSYWFVPPGHSHELEGATPGGCRLFYVDVPQR
jgi:quercetin dioxygenase-like cupin family protein